MTIEYEADDATPPIEEATTSWSYVGPGLPLSMELLGPQYSPAVESLASGVRLFFSREVRATAGEDLVEKQHSEVGSMPVVVDESAEYRYTDQNRQMVRHSCGGKRWT